MKSLINTIIIAPNIDPKKVEKPPKIVISTTSPEVCQYISCGCIERWNKANNTPATPQKKPDIIKTANKQMSGK